MKFYENKKAGKGNYKCPLCCKKVFGFWVRQTTIFWLVKSITCGFCGAELKEKDRWRKDKMRPVEMGIPEAGKYVKVFTTRDKIQHEQNGNLCFSKWARHIGNRTESGVYETWVHRDDLCKLR